MSARLFSALATACTLLVSAAAANANPPHLVSTQVVDAAVSKAQHQLAVDFQTGRFSYKSTAELIAIEKANEPQRIVVLLSNAARLTKIAFRNGAFPEGDYVFYYKLTPAQERVISTAVRAKTPLTITYVHGGTAETQKVTPAFSR